MTLNKIPLFRVFGGMMKNSLFFGIAVLLMFCKPVFAQTDTVGGLYNAVLYHEDGDFYQYAKVTLRTINPDGVMQISANVRIFYGEADSTEYLTYDFDNVALNLLTRQISIVNEANEISMVGFLKDGKIIGEWFSTLVGRVGKFESQKRTFPSVPDGLTVVESVSGFYKGKLENANSGSNLPERISISFVSSLDTSGTSPELKISGNIRFYLGPFGSQEYVETVFTDIQYNVYNRFITLKTEDYNLTFKGYIKNDGQFKAEVFSDGLGEVGKIEVNKQ